MQFDESQPIYLQVVLQIKKEIVTGRKKNGEKLKSGRELALEYHINPNTAARVYQTLEAEGVAFTKRGLGTFVTEDAAVNVSLRKELAADFIARFKKDMSELGYTEDEMRDLI